MYQYQRYKISKFLFEILAVIWSQQYQIMFCLLYRIPNIISNGISFDGYNILFHK